MTALALAALGSFVAAIVISEIVRRIAIRRALLDAINERSLHKTPTPRLGGVGIVVAVLAASAAVWRAWTLDLGVVLAAGLAIALVGLRDDLKPMSSGLRLLLQCALASTVVIIGGVPALLIAPVVVIPLPSAVTGVLLVVWVVGVLNIYNFMDGMDGLAGSQAVIASVAFALVLASSSAAPRLAMLIGAATLGFVVHNFPPARIFMGDAGSTFLGFAFAALGVVGLRAHVPLPVTALPLAPFLLDGTFTLLRRLRRGERIWTAHRTHLYQRAVQTGLEHRDVLIVYIVWMAVAAGAAVAGARSTPLLIGGWAVACVGLAVVHAWVVRREAHSPRADGS